MSGFEFIRARKVSDGVLLWIEGVTPPGMHCHLCFRVVPGTTCQQVRVLLHADDAAGRTLAPFTLWETPPVEKAQLDVLQATLLRTRERFLLDLVRVWLDAARCESLASLLENGWKPLPVSKRKLDALDKSKPIILHQEGFGPKLSEGAGDPPYALMKPGPSEAATPEGIAFHITNEKFWSDAKGPEPATCANSLIVDWFLQARNRLRPTDQPIFITIAIEKFEELVLRMAGRFLWMAERSLTDPQNRKRLRSLVKGIVKTTPAQKPDWKKLLGYDDTQSAKLIAYMNSVEEARAREP